MQYRISQQKITRFFNFFATLRFYFHSCSNRQNFYTTQLFTKQEWNCVNLFSNLLWTNETESYKQMSPKVCENLRVANFNPKFANYEKSVIDMEMCADS